MQNKFKEIRSVTLMALLDARERRAELQKKLILEYGVTLVSFTMNIAGPVKNSPLIERAFEYGLKKLHAVLPNDKVLFENVTSDFCGCAAMISVDLPAGEVKRMCVNIEEKSRLGRLFDIDVLDAFGIERAWLERFPRELSGGELQRFCVARALMSGAEYLICDEISTMLDVITQAQIWNVVLAEAEKRNMGLLAVTHNRHLAQRIATKVIDLTE